MKFPLKYLSKNAIVSMVSKLSRAGKGLNSIPNIQHIHVLTGINFFLHSNASHASLSPFLAWKPPPAVPGLVSSCRDPLSQPSPLPLLTSCSANMPLTRVLAHQPSSTQPCSQPAGFEIVSSLGFQHVWGIAVLILPPYCLICSRSDVLLQICLNQNLILACFFRSHIISTLLWEATVCCLFSACGTQVSCLYFKNFLKKPFWTTAHGATHVCFIKHSKANCSFLKWKLLFEDFCPSLPESRRAQIVTGTVLLLYPPHLYSVVFFSQSRQF